MPRDERLYLDEIVEGCRRIRIVTDGITREEFVSDIAISDATLHNLFVIGEAVKQLSPTIQAQSQLIPWRNIARLRDRLAHHYFSIDLEMIWDIVTSEVAVLDSEVRRILDDWGG